MSDRERSRIHEVSSLCVIAVSLPVGIWWLFRAPNSGRAGILLALVATLMPLCWDKVGVYFRSAWIATIFLLFIVETRAINKDRQDYIDSQKALSDAQTQGFKDLLTQEKKDVSDLLQQGAKNVKNILDQEQQNFNQALVESSRRDRQETKRFAALLGEQKNLFDQQREMIESLNGHLLPGSAPMPSMAELFCDGMKVDSEDYFIVTGGLTNIVHKFPYSVLVVHGKNVISISKSNDGSLVLFIDVINKDGSLIVRFDEEGFVVNPNLIKGHPNKSTLVVEDLYGNEVLRAQYENKRLLRLQGKISVDGQVVTIPFARSLTPALRTWGVPLMSNNGAMK